jgi:zinc protease
LTPPAVRSELEVVRNERRESVDDDPDGQLDEALWRAVFGDHPYGRPVIGAAADLEQLGIDDAVAFYRARYVPSQVAVVVAGGFDADAVLRAVARYHGALPQAASDPPRVQPKRPATVSTVVDLPIDASAARLAVAWRTVPLGHTDHAALALAAEALCGADSARWHRALVDEDRVASAVSCHQIDLRLEGLFELRVTLRPGQRAKDAESRLGALLQALFAAQPLTDGEVRAARLRLQTSRLRELAAVDGRAEVLGSAWATSGDLSAGEQWWQRLAQLSTHDVNQVLRRWLVPSGRVTVRAEPAPPPVSQRRSSRVRSSAVRTATDDGGRG